MTIENTSVQDAPPPDVQKIAQEVTNVWDRLTIRNVLLAATALAAASTSTGLRLVKSRLIAIESGNSRLDRLGLCLDTDGPEGLDNGLWASSIWLQGRDVRALEVTSTAPRPTTRGQKPDPNDLQGFFAVDIWAGRPGIGTKLMRRVSLPENSALFRALMSVLEAPAEAEHDLREARMLYKASYAGKMLECVAFPLRALPEPVEFTLYPNTANGEQFHLEGEIVSIGERPNFRNYYDRDGRLVGSRRTEGTINAPAREALSKIVVEAMSGISVAPRARTAVERPRVLGPGDWQRQQLGIGEVTQETGSTEDQQVAQEIGIEEIGI